MEPSYVHLHVHSQFSLLEGTASVEALVRHAAACGMSVVALTDRDVLSGAIPFARAARAQNLRPIAGLCLTLDNGSSLTLLAQDRRGYTNLCRLSTLQRSRPGGTAGLALDVLRDHQTGLLLLSGGREGPLWSLAARGQESELRRWVRDLQTAAEPGALYIEVQRVDRRDEPVLAVLKELASAIGLPLVATHPVRYLRPEEADLHRLLSALRSGRQMDDPLLARESPGGWHFVPAQEMEARFQDVPEALAGMAEVVARCEDGLPRPGDLLTRSERLPWAEPVADLFWRRTLDQAERHWGQPVPGAVSERLEAELAALQQAEAVPWVIMLGEGLQNAYQEGLLPYPMGPVLGLLSLYLLGGSLLDPLSHGIGLGPLRELPALMGPEIHLLLAAEQRDALFSLFRQRWGEERVAEIGQVVRYDTEEAWRAVAGAYRMEAGRVDELAAVLAARGGGEEPFDWRGVLSQARHQVEELALRGASMLFGRPRGWGKKMNEWALAPCGFVGVVPLADSAGPSLVVHAEPESLRFVGAAVLRPEEDRTLTLITEIGRLAGPGVPAPPAVPQQDDLAAGLLNRGETVGCPRFERPGIRRLLRESPVATSSDLAHVLALYRSAGMRRELPDTFLRRQRGEEAASAPAPCLSGILGDTQGLLLYREQLWQLAREVLGWSTQEVEEFLSCLLPPALPRERGRWWELFRRGLMEACAVGQRDAEAVWEEVCTAARVIPSRYWAAARAHQAWWAAYYKSHDPAAFVAALLSWGGSGAGRAAAVYLAEARRYRVDVRPPHILHSQRQPSLERPPGGQPLLWLGLDAVAGLSDETAGTIVRERQRAPFTSVEDFLERVRPAPREAERLARVGALDLPGQDRSAVLREVRWRTRGPPEQMLLPFEFDEAAAEPSLEQVLAAEQEVLGMAVSVHPLDLVQERVQALRVTTSSAILQKVGDAVTVAGAMVRLQLAAGEEEAEAPAVLTLEDREGQLEVVVPGVLQLKLQAAQPGDIVVARGVVQAEVAWAGGIRVSAEHVEIWPRGEKES